MVIGLCVGVLPSQPTAFAYSSYGLANRTCEVHIEKRGDPGRNNDPINTAYTHSFIAGYLTAANTLRGMAAPNANNIDVDIRAVLEWLDDWCLLYPDKRLANGLEEYWVQEAQPGEKIRSK